MQIIITKSTALLILSMFRNMNLYLANKLYEECFCLDLYQCGITGMFNEIEDPALQQLVPKMIDMLVGSSTVNTVVKYSAGWKYGRGPS